ncbi:hypothetical protein SAMN02799631_04353 [Methylobacterium sp. 174MFSha1.1]|uniref:hypothetical protein n=1 Tax=Methylobacterium sp. 174MFSha1.1 TaxID=1502749 RepID=UPI0008E79DE3|nr:hypothetical protein [Methylobacterium sp. 174MFSha1.1]SFV06095.1 hypothetical protein SAMN02799631_04353 [Methylobacterium sp. 174MFSha1.1]
MTKTNLTHILINTKTRQQQSKPLTRTWADRMAEQLNSVMGAGTVVVVPVGWQGVGLN